MAMNGDTLGLQILAEINDVENKADREELFKAIGRAIVTHITTYGQVAVVSVSGVTTGPGVSGPGTGTIV